MVRSVPRPHTGQHPRRTGRRRGPPRPPQPRRQPRRRAASSSWYTPFALPLATPTPEPERCFAHVVETKSLESIHISTTAGEIFRPQLTRRELPRANFRNRALARQETPSTI